jgi:hypothetical protein
MVPAAADNSTGNKKAQQAWVVNGASGNWLRLVNNSTELFATGSGVTYATNGTHSYLTLNGNKTLDLAAILNTAHTTRATATEATLTAVLGGNLANSVTIKTTSALNASSGTVAGERYTTGAALTASVSASFLSPTNGGTLLGADDYVTFSVGSNSVTATGGTTDALADAIAAKWLATYGVAGTASASSNATVTVANDNAVITVTQPKHYRAANADTIALSVTVALEEAEAVPATPYVASHLAAIASAKASVVPPVAVTELEPTEKVT